MPLLRITSSQILAACQRLLTREEEAQIDNSVLQIRRERIAAAALKQKLGAGLVNVIRDMPVSNLGPQLVASPRFREEMHKLGVAKAAPGPQETLDESEEALEDAQNQSRVRGELLSLSIGQLVESERTRKNQAAIIRDLRASKRRQLLWLIAISSVGVALGFAAGYVAGQITTGLGL